MDLDIDNYNLDDILHLFKIPVDFNETHLKFAKKIVLKTHPDKSKLDPKYFLFYSKAYKVLYSIHTFKNKSMNKNTENVDDDLLESQHIVLDKFFEQNKQMTKKPREFNKWFNEQFDKYKIEEETNNTGYGDWLKTDNGIYHTEKTNIANMSADFEKHKKHVRSLVVYNGIDEVYSPASGTLLGGEDNGFTSSLFSNLSYQDIKQAHTESIIPVTDDDFKNLPKFNNLEDYKKFRNGQNITPLSEQESNEYLKSQTTVEETNSTRRAYFYAKQLEESNKKNQQFWGKLQKITNT